MPQSQSMRGVWRMRFTSESGRPLLVIVAADGHRIAERELFPTDNVPEIEERMHQLLDREDPIRLQAVS